MTTCLNVKKLQRSETFRYSFVYSVSEQVFVLRIFKAYSFTLSFLLLCGFRFQTLLFQCLVLNVLSCNLKVGSLNPGGLFY